MQIYKTLRGAVILKPLMLTLVGLAACPLAWPQAPDEQKRSGNQGQGQIFKGRGDARRPDSEKETPAPKAPLKITAAQIASYLKAYKLPRPGSTYVKLSMQTPFVANKGYLVFAKPHLINTCENFGNWGIQEQFQGEWQTAGLMSVWLKSEAAGRRYLFDCSVVAPGVPSEPFILLGPNNLQQTFAPVIQQGQHLLFVLETIDAGWYGFSITRKRPWYAYSCEVTNL